jgi:hypothetical protein
LHCIFVSYINATTTTTLISHHQTQDWDFPDFRGASDVKIVAADFSSFTLRLPTWLVFFIARFVPDITKYCQIFISSKWFNYFGIMMGVAFDWAYW